MTTRWTAGLREEGPPAPCGPEQGLEGSEERQAVGEVENKWSVVSMLIIARTQRGILRKGKAQNSKVKRDFLGNTFQSCIAVYHIQVSL